MPIRTDQAVVLRLTDYSETSQIASLFTTGAGLVRLIAKGARRGTRTRVAPGLDLLEYGEVSYAPARGDAGLGTLTEWVQRDTFAGLRVELRRLYAGLYAAELTGALTEEDDPHAGLFEALLRLLRELAGEERGSATELVTAIIRFQAGLLRAIGYAPNLSQCVSCGRTGAGTAGAFFSSAAGGLICRDCEMHHVEKRRIPAGLLGAKARTTDPRQWFDLLNYHLTHVAGRPFKTAERLGTLLAASPG